MKYVIEIKPEYDDDFKGIIVQSIVEGGKIGIELLSKEDLEVLNSDYVNEHFGELQETAYKEGYETGKNHHQFSEDVAKSAGMGEMYRAIGVMLRMTTSERMDVFGMSTPYDVVHNLKPSEFYTKLTAYEQKQKEDAEIKVGDEVTPKSKDADWKGIVIGIEGGDAQVMTPDGYSCGYPLYIMKRTGRHFPEVARLLEKMKGE